MIFPLDPREGLIILPTRIVGPRRELIFRMVLDTGASASLLAWSSVIDLGYDPEILIRDTWLTTASEVKLAARVALPRIEVLEQSREHFPIVCHALPREANVDGVLGLDFFRGLKLTLDFRAGLVILE